MNLITNDKKIILDSLKNNKIVAVKTETTLGFISTISEYNKNKLYELKERDRGKPFTIFISDYKMLSMFGIKEDVYIKRLFDQFTPGPITIILESNYFNDLDKVAFRIPDNKELVSLIKDSNMPLYSTSANVSGKSVLVNLNDVDINFRNIVIWEQNGVTPSNVASTIVFIDKGNVSLIREGSIKLNDIIYNIKSTDY